MFPDVPFDGLLGLVKAEMSFAKKIRFQFQKLIHGAMPVREICPKPGEKGAVDILAEEDTAPVAIEVEGKGTGGMSGSVQKMQGFPVENQHVFIT